MRIFGRHVQTALNEGKRLGVTACGIVRVCTGKHVCDIARGLRWFVGG